MEEYSEEKLNAFDAIVNMTYLNIYTLSKGEQSINILPVGKGNEERFFIYVAKLVSDQYHWPITYKGNWFARFRFYHRYKDILKVKPKKYNGEKGINVAEVLHFMRAEATRLTHNILFSYGEITEAYCPKKGDIHGFHANRKVQSLH